MTNQIRLLDILQEKYDNQSPPEENADKIVFKERVEEIRNDITNDIFCDGDLGLEAFVNFIKSDEMTPDEAQTLNYLLLTSVDRTKPEFYTPTAVLVRRSIKWQAERLARMEK